MTHPANTACIRAARPTDQGFVGSTWVRSLLRRGSSYDKREARPHEDMVNAIFDRSDTRVLVRHHATDENAILAWVCYAMIPRIHMIHWIYCRKDYRERGHARSLLEAVGCTPRTVMVYTAMPRGQAGHKLLTCYPAATLLPMSEFLTGESR